MPNSVREQIELNLKTVLESVVTPTYGQTIQKVFRYGQPFTDLNTIPAAQILPENEDKEPRPHPLYSCVANYTIALVVESQSETIAAAVNQILADVEKALMIDVTRGGLATETLIRGNAVFESGPAEPIGDCRLRIAVKYRHQHGDPFTASP